MDQVKHPPRDWEGAVEKQIREAMERGEFDNLPGKGKPLDLGYNPYAPEDWQLAFKLLQDAGIAPDWIEQGKEIRVELDALASWLARQMQWQRERAAKLTRLPLPQATAEREHLADAREKTCAEYRRRAGTLNKMIDTYNLKAPSGAPHFVRLRIEEEIQKFREACAG